MKTVFLVTSGEYSDYSIEAVFSTRENAHAFIDSGRKRLCEAEIEEFIVDPCSPKINPVWYVRFDLDGNVMAVKNEGQPTQPVAITAGYDFHRNNIQVYGISAEDERTALKIAAHERAMFLANERTKS